MLFQYLLIGGLLSLLSNALPEGQHRGSCRNDSCYRAVQAGPDFKVPEIGLSDCYGAFATTVSVCKRPIVPTQSTGSIPVPTMTLSAVSDFATVPSTSTTLMPGSGASGSGSDSAETETEAEGRRSRHGGTASRLCVQAVATELPRWAEEGCRDFRAYSAACSCLGAVHATTTFAGVLGETGLPDAGVPV